MAKSIDIILISYKQSRKDARTQSRCVVKRNACQTTTDHHTSPVGTAELCRAYSALIALGHDDMELVGEGWLLLSNTMDAATDHCEYFSVDRDNFFVGIYLT